LVESPIGKPAGRDLLFKIKLTKPESATAHNNFGTNAFESKISISFWVAL
jgi:hypothetical protein